MKVEFSVDALAQAGGGEVRAMGIDESKQAKLFTILSDGLYKDKITSVIRELCSNAHDAHTMAGNTAEPFILTMPTWSEPVFAIRDYGIGLTVEEAYRTILSFLGSAKDTSDSVIGGWGLGSKSPFAYTTGYEITVYKGGRFGTFNCWKDNEGIPQNILFDEGDTDEADGVHIKVPVKRDDTGKFQRAVLKYLSRTDFKIVVGNPNDEERLVDPSVKVVGLTADGFEWSLRKNANQGGAGECYVLYGGFSYPISELPGLDEVTTKVIAGLVETTNYNLVLSVRVGECDFAVSRETMRDTPKTLSYVHRAVDALFRHLDVKVQEHRMRVLGPVAKMVRDARAAGRPIDLSAMAVPADDECEDPIFNYFSYRAYIAKMGQLRKGTAIVPLADGLHAAKEKLAEEDLVGLSSVKIEVKSDHVTKDSAGKRWAASRQLHRVKISVNYKKGQYVTEVSLNATPVQNFVVDALAPIDQQYRFLWSDKRVAKKFLGPKESAKRGTMLVVEAPTIEECPALLAGCGIVGATVEPLEDYFDWLDGATPNKDGKVRAPRSAIPKFIRDYQSEEKWEYDEDQDFVYVADASQLPNSEERKAIKDLTGKIVFLASPNFMTKNLKWLPNVYPLSDITIADFPADMPAQIQLHRDHEAFEAGISALPYWFRNILMETNKRRQTQVTCVLNLFRGLGLDLRPILRARKALAKRGRPNHGAARNYIHILSYFGLPGGEVAANHSTVCNVKVMAATLARMLDQPQARFLSWERSIAALPTDYATFARLASQINMFGEEQNECITFRY
jgi:hypothetical protein